MILSISNSFGFLALSLTARSVIDSPAIQPGRVPGLVGKQAGSINNVANVAYRRAVMTHGMKYAMMLIKQVVLPRTFLLKPGSRQYMSNSRCPPRPAKSSQSTMSTCSRHNNNNMHERVVPEILNARANSKDMPYSIA